MLVSNYIRVYLRISESVTVLQNKQRCSAETIWNRNDSLYRSEGHHTIRFSCDWLLSNHPRDLCHRLHQQCVEQVTSTMFPKGNTFITFPRKGRISWVGLWQFREVQKDTYGILLSIRFPHVNIIPYAQRKVFHLL